MKTYTRYFTKARRPPHRRQGMNKAEEKYAAVLEAQKLAGDIDAYVYEGIKLKLADNTYYSPDFVVVTPEYVTLIELKARWRKRDGTSVTHWEDDARVKYKVAAEQFWWFRFAVVYYDKAHGWKMEYFN
jgi:hypothetical protein